MKVVMLTCELCFVLFLSFTIIANLKGEYGVVGKVTKVLSSNKYLDRLTCVVMNLGAISLIISMAEHIW